MPLSCLSRKSVCARLSRLYRSLAQLIRWADQVVLQGVSHDKEESTDGVTTLIRALLDSVKVSICPCRPLCLLMELWSNNIYYLACVRNWCGWLQTDGKAPPPHLPSRHSPNSGTISRHQRTCLPAGLLQKMMGG